MGVLQRVLACIDEGPGKRLRMYSGLPLRAALYHAFRGFYWHPTNISPIDIASSSSWSGGFEALSLPRRFSEYATAFIQHEGWPLASVSFGHERTSRSLKAADVADDAHVSGVWHSTTRVGISVFTRRSSVVRPAPPRGRFTNSCRQLVNPS